MLTKKEEAAISKLLTLSWQAATLMIQKFVNVLSFLKKSKEKALQSTAADVPISHHS